MSVFLSIDPRSWEHPPPEESPLFDVCIAAVVLLVLVQCLVLSHL